MESISRFDQQYFVHGGKILTDWICSIVKDLAAGNSDKGYVLDSSITVVSMDDEQLLSRE